MHKQQFVPPKKHSLYSHGTDQAQHNRDWGVMIITSLSHITVDTCTSQLSAIKGNLVWAWCQPLWIHSPPWHLRWEPKFLYVHSFPVCGWLESVPAPSCTSRILDWLPFYQWTISTYRWLTAAGSLIWRSLDRKPIEHADLIKSQRF